MLANEEVINGRSERGDHPCVRRPLKQWMFKITAYADRLLEDLDDRRLAGVDQGHAARVDRPLRGRPRSTFRSTGGPDEKLTVFTTRPDTLWGATFMVVAPEHPLVDGSRPTNSARRSRPTCAQAARRSPTSSAPTWPRKRPAWPPAATRSTRCSSPTIPRRGIPIFVADYVLISYGTGAIMAVPGHDERDFEFAKQVRPADRRGRAAARGHAGAGRRRLLHR